MTDNEEEVTAGIGEHADIGGDAIVPEVEEEASDGHSDSDDITLSTESDCAWEPDKQEVFEELPQPIVEEEGPPLGVEEGNEAESFEEDKYGVKYASDCEVCKVVATEFEVVERLQLQLWKLHVDCEGQAVRE